MVGRAAPLFVDVRVTSLACLRRHEEFRAEPSTRVCPNGTGKEISLYTLSLKVLGRWWHGWVDDSVTAVPSGFPGCPCRTAHDESQQQECGETQRAGTARPPAASGILCQQKQHSGHADINVRVQQWSKRP